MSPALFRGDIVLTRFPFTDLTGTSLRPALVVSQGQIGQDVVLVAISSVLRDTLAPTDYTVDTAHPEFVLTGLHVTSIFRMHKLAAVERSVIVRRLGRIGSQLQVEVDRLLRIVLASVDSSERHPTKHDFAGKKREHGSRTPKRENILECASRACALTAGSRVSTA